jgi:hypothetical protein
VAEQKDGAENSTDGENALRLIGAGRGNATGTISWQATNRWQCLQSKWPLHFVVESGLRCFLLATRAMGMFGFVCDYAAGVVAPATRSAAAIA